ncbi:Na/Pi cotransporter family protein [Spongiibacter sp. KMU-158]|uniref:Na/Pi cotransporter family protein n=1 Tax=Spongiibacter pelagi TaxID=2760804 RepID=A0A927C0D3_9GAMM|nr:Na/Pi symporter [Spongiibacter pelagi]MBD2857858.1 Na/Pi cotransporter family protein [Spongiibacter pelagi]
MSQWFDVLGGLGVFLLGVVIMTDGLKGLAGDALRQTLTRFTRSPYSGAATGAFSTAILQSSSATTVAAVGFVGAGLLTFSQALGIIFGANLGTTITGWLVALVGFKLKLDSVMLPMVLLGVLLHLFGRGRAKSGGLGLAGFGLIFVGISAMQAGMSGLEGQVTPESFPPNTLLGRFQLLLIGVVITLITQSSSAGVAAALTAVHTGTISFEQAAAMVIGMDVGTTATALFATLGGAPETRRTGYSHVVYNLITGLGAFFLLIPYVWVWQNLAPGVIYTQSEIALVAFHTSFNALGVLLILPFTGAFSRLMFRLVPERQSGLVLQLDRHLIKEPVIALENLRVNLNQIAAAQFQFGHDLLRDKEAANPERLQEIKQAIEQNQRYLDEIHTRPDSKREWSWLLAEMHAVDHMQRLNYRLQETQRAQSWRNSADLNALGHELELGFAALVNGVSENGAWSNIAERASSVAQHCRDFAQQGRELVMAKIARGDEDTVQGDTLLESSRWLHRVAGHCWRVSHYLSEAEMLSQSEKMSPAEKMPIEPDKVPN